MDKCLQCSQRIPVQTILQGETRFCCPSHRLAFQLAQQRIGGRIHLLDIPEPGSDWGTCGNGTVDSSSIAELLPLACGVLRIPGGPRVGPLQRLPWKYEIAFPSHSPMAPPELGFQPLLETYRVRAREGRRIARMAVEALPRRQDRLARYAMVLGLLRLKELLKIRGPEALPVKAGPKQKTFASPLYRNVHGFPMYAAGAGEPALGGFQQHPAMLGSSRGTFSVRPMDVLAEDWQPAPLSPQVGVRAALTPDNCGWVWQPLAAATPAGGRRAPQLDGGAIPFAVGVQMPAVKQEATEPWGLTATYIPVLEGVGGVAQRLYGVTSQLRNRRDEAGLHVPQMLLLPLRPKLLLAKAATESEGASDGHDSSVVSISSLRKALGSRR